MFIYTLLSIGYIRDSYAIVLMFVFTIIYTILIKKPVFKLHLSMQLFFLTIFSLSYALLGSQHGRSTLTFAFFPPCAYIIGRTLGSIFLGDERKIKKAIMCFILGSFLHAIMNYFSNFGAIDRDTIDIWSGKYLAATGQSLLLTGVYGLLIYALLCVRGKERVAFFALWFISFLYAFVLATRMAFVTIISSFLVSFIVYYRNVKVFRKQRALLGTILVVLVLGLLYTYDLFDIQSAILSSNMGVRLSIAHSSDDPSVRLSLLRKAIEYLPHYPLGGWPMQYAHNIWLDVANIGGWSAMIGLIVFQIGATKRMIRYAKSSSTTVPMKVFVVSIYASSMIHFLDEPVVQGSMMVFLMFIAINGIIDEQADRFTLIVDVR